MRILIVDDSKTARLLVIRHLSSLDHVDIVEAGDGRDALARLKDTPDIKLVLLDRYMPNMDGLEFMRHFKQDPANQYILVSMLTTEDDMDEKFRAIAEFQADYYITKPVTVQKLIRMFAHLFPDQ